MKLRVLVLACERHVLLRKTVQSVCATMPVEHTRWYMWIDAIEPRPASPWVHANRRKRFLFWKERAKREAARERVLAYATKLEAGDRRETLQPWKVLRFERHVGTRALWLTALGRPVLQLVLEDDVVLLPGAFLFAQFAFGILRRRADLLGASLQTQPTVAMIENAKAAKTVKTVDDPDARAGAAKHRVHTYPLVGSHGFLMTPAGSRRFRAYREARSGCDLLIPWVRTTQWYVELMRSGQVSERMWSQEMVAFARYRHQSTLYPPSSHPFALHCASDHGVDRKSAHCVKRIANLTLARTGRNISRREAMGIENATTVGHGHLTQNYTNWLTDTLAKPLVRLDWKRKSINTVAEVDTSLTPPEQPTKRDRKFFTSMTCAPPPPPPNPYLTWPERFASWFL